MHIPFIVRGPGVERGVMRDDLIEHIDLAAISLALAGLEIPKAMQGRNVLAKDYKPRDAVFAARDRCDETVEHLRGVRTAQFKYIRNFLPSRPHLQPNAYKDDKEIVRRLRELHAQGKLPELTENLLFAPARPAEELYDLQSDPHETRNLAADPKYKKTLEQMRARLSGWMKETGDRGRQPEPAAMYDSDMAVYLEDRGRQGRRPLADAERDDSADEEVGGRRQIACDDQDQATDSVKHMKNYAQTRSSLRHC